MLRELAFVLMMVVSADLPFQVIVHRSNPATSITRAELSAICPIALLYAINFAAENRAFLYKLYPGRVGAMTTL